LMLKIVSYIFIHTQHESFEHLDTISDNIDVGVKGRVLILSVQKLHTAY
jgi:hypothetical protein